jgi:hypothetical protein
MGDIWKAQKDEAAQQAFVFYAEVAAKEVSRAIRSRQSNTMEDFLKAQKDEDVLGSSMFYAWVAAREVSRAMRRRRKLPADAAWDLEKFAPVVAREMRDLAAHALTIDARTTMPPDSDESDLLPEHIDYSGVLPKDINYHANLAAAKLIQAVEPAQDWHVALVFLRKKAATIIKRIMRRFVGSIDFTVWQHLTEVQGAKASPAIALDLVGFDPDRKFDVIQVVSEITGLGPEEAQGLVEEAPTTLMENLSWDKAEAYLKMLEDAGAQTDAYLS